MRADQVRQPNHRREVPARSIADYFLRKPPSPPLLKKSLSRPVVARHRACLGAIGLIVARV